MQDMNALAVEAFAGQAAVEPKTATATQVEGLVKLLERRLHSNAELTQLQAATRTWSDNGGKLSSDVVEEDIGSAPYVLRHRVLRPSFKLKSKAFMLTYNSEAFSVESWGRFKDFVVGLATRFGARAWAACLEKSLRSATPNVHHCHAYLLWTDGVGIEIRNLDLFFFEQVRPRVDVCVARMATTSPHTAALHGLWYVSVFKEGTVMSETNYKPGERYKPKATWLQALFEDRKMCLDDYLSMSATWFPVGHASRKRDAEEAFRDQKTRRAHKHVKDEMRALQAAQAWREPRSFPEVDSFVTFFDATPRWRRPALLIVGPTHVGKSLLAGSVLTRVGGMLGLSDSSFLEVTVEEDGALDFADFDIDRHSGVLLDGVADVAVLKRHRETLQGRPKIVKGARSPTMKHSYEFSLARRAVIITMDLSASSLGLLETDHWLSDRRNLLILRLLEPAWEGAPRVAPALPQGHLLADAMEEMCENRTRIPGALRGARKKHILQRAL